MPSGVVVLVAQLWLWGLPDEHNKDDGDAGDSDEVGNEKSDRGILMGSSERIAWQLTITNMVIKTMTERVSLVIIMEKEESLPVSWRSGFKSLLKIKSLIWGKRWQGLTVFVHKNVFVIFAAIFVSYHALLNVI